MVYLFEAEKKVAVVGAHVIPQNALPLEAKYWSDQNQIRILESRVHSSSILIAPSYAYRRDILDSLPDDCIADDMYISFYANIKGWKSK